MYNISIQIQLIFNVRNFSRYITLKAHHFPTNIKKIAGLFHVTVTKSHSRTAVVICELWRRTLSWCNLHESYIPTGYVLAQAVQDF